MELELFSLQGAARQSFAGLRRKAACGNIAVVEHRIGRIAGRRSQHAVSGICHRNGECERHIVICHAGLGLCGNDFCNSVGICLPDICLGIVNGVEADIAVDIVLLRLNYCVFGISKLELELLGLQFAAGKCFRGPCAGSKTA